MYIHLEGIPSALEKLTYHNIVRVGAWELFIENTMSPELDLHFMQELSQWETLQILTSPDLRPVLTKENRS